MNFFQVTCSSLAAKIRKTRKQSLFELTPGKESYEECDITTITGSNCLPIRGRERYGLYSDQVYGSKRSHTKFKNGILTFLLRSSLRRRKSPSQIWSHNYFRLVRTQNKKKYILRTLKKHNIEDAEVEYECVTWNWRYTHLN